MSNITCSQKTSILDNSSIKNEFQNIFIFYRVCFKQCYVTLATVTLIFSLASRTAARLPINYRRRVSPIIAPPPLSGPPSPLQPPPPPPHPPQHIVPPVTQCVSLPPPPPSFESDSRGNSYVLLE